MSQRSRFFDSTAGDRVYTSDAWAQVIRGIIGDGVVAGADDELQVVEDSPAAMSVEVGLGKVFIRGYFLEVYAGNETLAISAADGSNPRIDRVVARRDLSGRTAQLAVLTGTPAASPTAPSLTQIEAGTWEISLAQILVPASSSSVINANITDERVYATTSAVDAILDGSTGHTHSGTDGSGPTIPWANVSSKPTTFAPTVHDHSDAANGGNVPWGSISSKPTTFAPSAHTHVDAATGGTVSHGVLTGVTEDAHHAKAHAHDGVDGSGTVTWASITGKPSTFAPSAHASSHGVGQTDPIDYQASNLAFVTKPDGTSLDGPHIYVGTATPSSPAPQEGDVWIKG